MTGQDRSEQVAFTAEGVPVSTLYDDPYFSLAGGLAETRHVFLSGNGLPDRLRDGFHVAELGFGTGLNLTALAKLLTTCSRGGGGGVGGPGGRGRGRGGRMGGWARANTL